MARSSRLSVCLAIVIRNSSNIHCAKSISRQRTTPCTGGIGPVSFTGPAHDLIGANTVPTQQDDLSPPDMLVWRIAVPHEHLQTAAISGLKRDGNSGSHTPDSHAPSALGIPTGIQMSDAIH